MILLYPNPEVLSTTIRFESQNEWVRIELIDLEGRSIKTVVDSNLNQGTHDIQFEIGQLSPGQYVVSVKKQSGFQRIKLLKIK